MILQHNNFYIHKFLKNKEMNEIYASYGIMHFAVGLISVFVPIYLYNLDYSVIQILLHFFLIALGFVVFSYVGIRAVSYFGVKHSMFLSVPFLILYFLGLKFLPEFPFLFFIIPFFMALKMSFYNFAFHLNFFAHSERKNTGKEIALIQGSALFAGALSPFIGGVLAEYLGFEILFLIGSAVLFLSIIPLFITRDTKESPRFVRSSVFGGIFKRNKIPMIASFSGYAGESWIGSILWPLFLLSILSSIESIGAVFSLTMLLSIFVLYFAGKQTDTKDKTKLLRNGTVLHSLGWIGRFFVSNFFIASCVDIYKNLSFHKLQISWDSYCYDIARSGDYFKFIVQREVIFNLARVVIVPIVMLIFFLDFHPFYVSFIFATVLSFFFVTLARYREHK